MLAEGVQPCHDSAREVAGRKRRCHRHGPEGSRSVVEVASGAAAREDLKTPMRGIDHDKHGTVCGVAQGTKQSATLLAQVPIRRTDKDRVLEIALGVRVIDGALDRVDLTG